MTNLFSFQGDVWMTKRSAAGKPLKHTWLANVPELTLQMSVETSNKVESFSGDKMPYGTLRRGKSATLTLTLDEITNYNLALALYATQVSSASGSVTGETLPTPLAVGDVIRLERPFASSVVLTAGGSPLVLGTAYRVESPTASLIEFLVAQAAAVTAAYSYEKTEAFTMFTKRPPERWLMLDGINTENDQPVIVDLFRCQFNPVGSLALINDEYGSLQLTGTVLYDRLNADNANLGGFGRMIRKGA